VDAVVALARALDLEVVAESVETGHQVTKLIHLGCEQAQASTSHVRRSWRG